jgi:hypothetical protein
MIITSQDEVENALPAANGSTTIRRLGGKGGSGSDMSQCFLTLRDNGNYTTLYPDQDLLAKNWREIIVDGVFNGDTLVEYRVREATNGEHGRVALRQRSGERPNYAIRNPGIIDADRKKYPVKTNFDGETVVIPVPVEWRV